MKGSAFENLPKLKHVFVSENKCISRYFYTEEPFIKGLSEHIRDISKTIDENCGIDRKNTQIAFEKTPVSQCFLVDNFICITCEMTTYTAIKDIGYTILDSPNNATVIMDLRDNRNIEFLPNSPNDKFPNLKKYQASRCAIREVSKRNFENLHQLTLIELQENQIFAVLSDTFEGLKNLKTLDLSKSLSHFFIYSIFSIQNLQATTKSTS